MSECLQLLLSLFAISNIEKESSYRINYSVGVFEGKLDSNVGMKTIWKGDILFKGHYLSSGGNRLILPEQNRCYLWWKQFLSMTPHPSVRTSYVASTLNVLLVSGLSSLSRPRKFVASDRENRSRKKCAPVCVW